MYTLDTGVYLAINGSLYANDSDIFTNEVGITPTNALQCITDRSPCCQTRARPNRVGEWYYPGGMTTVPGPLQNPTTFSRTRGNDGTVNLNRVNANIMMPTGLFCCEVPDANNNDWVLCINIGKSP